MNISTSISPTPPTKRGCPLTDVIVSRLYETRRRIIKYNRRTRRFFRHPIRILFTLEQTQVLCMKSCLQHFSSFLVPPRSFGPLLFFFFCQSSSPATTCFLRKFDFTLVFLRPRLCLYQSPCHDIYTNVDEKLILSISKEKECVCVGVCVRTMILLKYFGVQNFAQEM